MNDSAWLLLGIGVFVAMCLPLVVSGSPRRAQPRHRADRKRVSA
jgi:hypothetical protein